MSEGGKTGIVTQAKRIKFINLWTFLVCLALLIVNIVIYCLYNGKDTQVAQDAQLGTKITNVVVGSLILVTMAGSFALSVSLKKTIKADRADGGGIKLLLLFMWIFTAFYLVMYILGNVASVLPNGLGGNEMAWGICQIIWLCMPALTFIMGCLINHKAKKLA